ncbi:uncharacterized protein LOC128169804 [Crassostrea angulata]|uniref:uncharacterized protein LOC128169804 n=1 Tax=Magallana angulata TaxID=2784310 RepID=UPI0022B145D8|nr:uncharacterized protein LOC128169804 [Crassostrea angulata]
MTANALVLFDVDGCTAIVDSKKLVLEGKDLVNGQQGYMKFGAEKLKVEILQLSDSKRELNTFEDQWSTSHRSMALDKEKRKRRNKPDGYLAVWPQDIDDVVQPDEDLPDPNAKEQDVEEDPIDDEHNETDEPKTGKPTKKSKETKEKTKEAKEKPKEKTGSKGRKITVLFEGGGDYSTDVAAPKRAPSYLEELSADERDLINLQVEQYKRGLETESTQTEAVVILGPNDVLPPLTSDAFQNIMELLKDLKKGQQDMKVQVEELKKEQREMKSQVQDLTREVAALKERPSSRNSVGSLLTTNELHELLVNSENNTSVETAQGLEEGLSKRQKNNEDKENTVHLGVTETMPILRRPKRTTASTAINSTTANVTTTASSPSKATNSINSENITTSAPTISSSTSAITTSSSFSAPTTSAPTTSNSTSATTTSNSTSASTTSNPTGAPTTSNSTSVTN